jgi:structure-specific endonuclease subunit SLX1
MSWSVYLIMDETHKHTYIGATTNLVRRLRQHNQIIKGGARATKLHKNWTFICYVTNFPNNIAALQFEWMWKHIKLNVFYKKYYSYKNCPHAYRFIKLYQILLANKTTSKSLPFCSYPDLLTIHIHRNYSDSFHQKLIHNNLFPSNNILQQYHFETIDTE